MTTAEAKLSSVPSVVIDASGVFKYVLIELSHYDQDTEAEKSQLLVRGWARAEFHADIYDEVEEQVKEC